MKTKYYFHIEAYDKEGYYDKERIIHLHILAKTEEEAIDRAKIIAKRKFYDCYRVDTESL